MINRRDFLKSGVAACGAKLLPPTGTAQSAAMARHLLDVATIQKYVTELPIQAAMPMDRHDEDFDLYTIGIRQFRQQMLPPGHPATTVWGYGSVRHPRTFASPALTIEAEHGRPVRVRWVNQLYDRKRRYLPHLLPVDPTLHWANPAGGPSGRDSRPDFTSTPMPFSGPVPVVTHLHGGRNTEESDGYAEAWYLPRALNIPREYANVGSYYEEFRNKSEQKISVPWHEGDSVFQYANQSRATTLWFHDHALGITRLNVYAGLAGFYIVRGGGDDLPKAVLPGPAPKLGDSPGKRYYEIPMAVQDRSFNTDGGLFYPGNRAFFDKLTGPYIPHSDVSPIWNPEFFGNTMVVNGRTWPVLHVEPRRYRFRILNACNSRFLILKIVTNPEAPRPASSRLPFWQIGNDGGFLAAPVQRDQVLTAPAERADIIVDFTSVPVGTELYLINEGPDEPFGGGAVSKDFPAANPRTTGQVMKLVIKPLTGPDTTIPPGRLTLPALQPLGTASLTRRLSLNEATSARLPGGPVREALLGTLTPGRKPRVLGWHDPITEDPEVGTTEIWELHNTTPDAHPIHVHEVLFQVLDRQRTGQAARPPEPAESGFKDTVIAYPDSITRIKMRFGQTGRYLWHCHILEHEDNEMMRPYQVRPSGR
jgi:bilirubin oxidase